MASQITQNPANSPAMQEYYQKVSTGKVVVKFFDPECSICKKSKEPFEAMVREFVDKVTFWAYDISQHSEPVRAANIHGVPTFIFYSNGKALDILAGWDENHLRHKIEALIADADVTKA